MTIANTDMAAAWDGAEGDDWSRDWERYDRSMAGYHRVLLDAAAITESDRVLDIGCGNGQTTRDAARVGRHALGVDLSSKMLARARELASAEGVSNVEFVQADAQVHPFEPASRDIAISRFGVMFFGDPVTAFANIGGALATGGRLALLVWQAPSEQAWLSALRGVLAQGRSLPMPQADMPGPFGLAGRDRTIGILRDAGFSTVDADSVDGGFWLGSDADDALAFVARMGMGRSALESLADTDRAVALDEIAALLAQHASPDGVSFGSAAWLVTARRYR